MLQNNLAFVTNLLISTIRYEVFIYFRVFLRSVVENIAECSIADFI
jgi:hypothetical protein